ncbi:hypothetical protein [Anaeromyxobacter diazotrophicus]|uniref:Uncharacterized protein n=1 Tax=Anaeromyxobacter diazotrophicus TaxID=2590199 RepID=A0A7I9VJK2_9BACT|nr:hypothetical protein [Anaeromyxobacter diazotrophicus]GEJ56606.1 hypothetical protein AMYX_13470 [Anaeromyxobacter diazotrophicus]
MDIFAGYSQEQLLLIDQLRQTARQKALLDEAAETAAESARRLKALGAWQRFLINSATRWWSTVAALLFPLSKWLPWLHGAAVAAGRRVLQPPALWPELRSFNPADGEVVALRPDDGVRKGAAYHALADEVRLLNDNGHLSVETALQMEELAHRIERGVDDSYIRKAMGRIKNGETLVETLRRRI